MTDPAQYSSRRAPGEQAAQLHQELLKEQFVYRMKSYAKGKGRPFPRSYEVFAMRMIMLMVGTPKRSFQVDIFDLVPESRPEEAKGLRATPERFFASIEGFDLLVRTKGIPHVRRESYHLRPEFEDPFRYGAVERKVRASRGHRSKAHEAVLGHLPLPSKAAFCGDTGESKPLADSRGVQEPGSASSSRLLPENPNGTVIHGQYKQSRKAVALPLPEINEAFKPFVSRILKTLEGIPGRTVLVPRCALVVIAKTEFTPEEFLTVLEGAAQAAQTNPRAQDHQREWVLSCLGRREWAQKFLLKHQEVEAPTEPISTSEPLPAAQGTPSEPPSIVDEITRLIMSKRPSLDRTGVRKMAKSLAPQLPRKAGGIAFLPHLVAVAEDSCNRRDSRGKIHTNADGYFLQILENPFQGVVEAAYRSYNRNPKAHLDPTIWEPPLPVNPYLANYPERFRDLINLDPKAKELYDELQALKTKSPAPDAPGFLDHFDAERRLIHFLVAVGEAKLEASQAEELRKDLLARLADAKLQEGSLAWQRAWDHHWSRIVGGIWGFTSEGSSIFLASTKPAGKSDKQDLCEAENPMDELSSSEEASFDGIQVEGDIPEVDPEPAPDNADSPLQGTEVPAIDPPPALWDAWSPEAVMRGSKVYDQILGQIEKTPKSVAARILRKVSPDVIAYQPGKKLLLACTATETVRSYQRYLQTAREVAESIGLPGLVIEFRPAQQAA